MFPLILLLMLSIFLSGPTHGLPTTPTAFDRKWTKLITCDNFLIGFKEAIDAYRECLSDHLSSLASDDQVWTEWPKGVEACKAIEPWDWFEVERIDQVNRGPLWYIRPSGEEPFTMVSIGVDQRDVAPERQLLNSTPQAQFHGVGVKFVFAARDWYNFSSIGRFHNVFRDSCFEIEGETPPLPNPSHPKSPPTDIPQSYIHFLEHPPSDIPPLIDLVWIDGKPLHIGGDGTVMGNVVFDANFRGYLIFDRKRIDAASNVCQIATRSRQFERYAKNITIPDGFYSPRYPSLPFTKVCQHKRIDLSLIIRRLVLTNPSFVPIRSEYHTTANNETYLSEFYVNVANSKCIAKYLAKRMDVEKCETRVVEKSKVIKDRFEVESEVIVVEK